ncbi:Ribosomal N-lysine methyltransferase 5 [Nakaseomyces glabratus]|nr:hypothetical protein J6894_04834 [Nakaseomyces glabratus]QNG16899.1 uncharacterized protein GWK60_M04323 [Nakaseomyces glabratus]SCV12939.1 Ribosomal N-lysine methyltransferase 5 [Nakaseomyces glabratus]SLM10723.1 Ribosomal N-lysine methyltransferase 5 [Nakaseomyces glabratus]
MPFSLVRIDEDDVLEYVFERYTAINSDADSIRQDLGIQDSKSTTLNIEIAPPKSLINDTNITKKGKKKKGNKSSSDYDFYSFEIKQNVTSLHSTRDNDNSTTGYVLWSLTPVFCEWLLYNEQASPLHRAQMVDICSLEKKIIHDIEFPSLLNEDTTVIELGSGISSVLPILCSNFVGTYICTDQRGILNGLKQNIANNLDLVNKRTIVSETLDIPNIQEQPTNSDDETIPIKPTTQLEVAILDWETFPKSIKSGSSNILTDFVKPQGTIFLLALDVIYNEYLINPFLHTLHSIMSYYKNQREIVALVGIHLRSDDIVQEFLEKVTTEFPFKLHVVDDPQWSHSRYDIYYITL